MKTQTSIWFLLLCLFSFLGAKGQTTTIFTSSTGYTVSLTLEILEINAPQNCNWGYNYTVDIAYDLVISGANAPSSLWVLQGQLACGNSNLFFNLPNNGGSGVVSTSNSWTSSTDCANASPSSLECFDAAISVLGPNLMPGNTIVDLSTSGNSPETFTWIGSSSTNWANEANWQEGAVPANNDNVVITNGTYQPEITGTISVSDMEIQLGASISFENSAATLSLKGDLKVNGSFDQVRGQVLFEGDELQEITGSSTVNFFDARIYTDDTVRCLTSVGFRGNLMPYKGVFDFNHQEISILSDAASTGAIVEIKAAAEILGDTITYQRYFPAGAGSWRLLGSPIKDATFEQWNDDFPTTGFTGADYPTFPSASNPWSNIREYEESFVNGEEADRNFGFQSIENITDTIITGKGYFVYFNPGPSTVDVRGPFNRGDLFFPLSYTASELGNGNDGWNLISNPYPATIDWDNLTDKIGLNDAIYAFDPSTGQYSSYVNGVSIGSLNSRISSGQAFWVQANQNNSLTGVTFSEASKTTLDGVFMRSNDFDTQSLVRIQLQSNGRTDEVVFGLNETSTKSFDTNFDAYKFYAADSSMPSIAIVTESDEEGNEDKLSISMIPEPESHSSIQLEVLPGAQGEFILANQEVDTFESNLCLVLEDSETNNFVAFNQGDLYPFVMGESSDPLRFKIHFNTPSELSKIDESCPDAANGSIIAQGYGEAPWSYIWRDEMGQTLKTSYGMNGPDELSELGPGFYEVEVVNNNELCASNIQIAQISAALPSEITLISERTSCNTPGTGSIEFNLSNEYTWNIEIQDENYNALAVLDDAQGTVLVNQLDAQEYHVVAISSCGLMADIPSVDLIDNSAPQADFDLSHTEVYVNQTVYITSNASNVQGLLYDFGDGTLDSLNANPTHQYSSPGIYEITQYAQSENCTESSTLMIEVFERESNDDMSINGFEADGALLSELESDAEGDNDLLELTIQENALQLDVKQAYEEEVLISIFNTSGQRISQQKQVQLDLGALLVPTSDLAMGVYYITVSAQSKVLFSQQFIQP